MQPLIYSLELNRLGSGYKRTLRGQLQPRQLYLISIGQLLAIDFEIPLITMEEVNRILTSNQEKSLNQFIRSYWKGFGDNPGFVCALGKIHGPEKLVMKGYYAKNWPAYLDERMGVRVRAICGHCREGLELRGGDLNDEELENEKFIREMNEKELQTFREYRQGTEDLIP
jgi:hypothetical protein